MKSWRKTAMFLVIGNICMGRSFAYWGIPPLRLFVGEIMLGLFLLFGPRIEGRHWIRVALNSEVFSRFRFLLTIFFLFGIFQVFRGIALGHPAFNAVRDLAFNYYPFYFFMGLWVGVQSPDFLQQFFPRVAIINGIYGLLFVFLLSYVPWSFPGAGVDVADVPIFGQPEYSAAILLALISLNLNWRRRWPILLINGGVLIGMLIRAQWLAFAMGLVLWAAVTRNLRKVMLGGAAVLIPLTLMYVTDFSIPGPETRGGTISTRDLVGRMLAPFDPDVAYEYVSDSADAKMHEDTAAFRTVWWLEIWYEIHEDLDRTFLGFGYGYPLGDLVSYLEGSATRTPHNAFFFALGYTGWIGVLIFAALQLELLRLLIQVYKTTGQLFGIFFWFAEGVYSLFTAFFEAPYGAIPFYILLGCACAPLLLKSEAFLGVASAPEIDTGAFRQPATTEGF